MKQAQARSYNKRITAVLAYTQEHSRPSTAEDDLQMDIAISVDSPIEGAERGIISKRSSAGHCARICHIEPRNDSSSTYFPYRKWLPQSEESLRDAPLVCHFVNLAPQVGPRDMISEVYLPIR